MTTKEKTLAVSAIRNGTVIDHIDAGRGMKIVKLLRLAGHQKKVSLGLNLDSGLLGLKDLIKVEDRVLTQQEANQVAILAPEATINIIKEYEVVEKFKVIVPEILEGVIPCPNALCISNHEDAGSSLHISQNGKRCIRLQCRYCRITFTQEEMK